VVTEADVHTLVNRYLQAGGDPSFHLVMPPNTRMEFARTGRPDADTSKLFGYRVTVDPMCAPDTVCIVPSTAGV